MTTVAMGGTKMFTEGNTVRSTAALMGRKRPLTWLMRSATLTSSMCSAWSFLFITLTNDEGSVH